MHKDKKMGMFIIKIGTPESQDKSEKKEDMYEEIKKERSEKVKDNKKEYSLADYGGYSPDDLVKKLEDIKESISNQNTREALMKIDSCIVRITKRELPSIKEDDPFSTINYQLDKILPNPGK
jgi:hypothetical protein